MFPKKKIRKSKLGLPPGSIVYTGQERTEEVKLSSIHYDSDKVEENQIDNLEDFFSISSNFTTNMLTVEGLHNTELIEEIGNRINLHYLSMEDIANINERTKVEISDEVLLFIFKRHSFNQEILEEEQISLILASNIVIIFLETDDRILKPIKDRIRSGFGRIRKMKGDYLFYALIDLLVDYNFNILELIGERIEKIEEELVINPSRETLLSIQFTKRDIINLRRNIFPIREIINSLIRGDSELITDSVQLFFRDIYDHIIRIIENLETYREMVSGLLDIYLSSISNKMNEIMKVLTIIATIFIPLTFIAGIYGMNFLHMPELAWKWGYLLVWIIMICITSLMIYYFKRKKWI